MRLPDAGSAEYVDVIRDLADRYNRNSPWPRLSPLHRQPEQNVDDPDPRLWAGAAIEVGCYATIFDDRTDLYRRILG